MSLYKIHPEDPLYPDRDGIEIDAPDILSDDCLRTVMIHSSYGSDLMCMSPNNATFRLSLIEPVVSFFSCCIETVERPEGRLLVTL